MPIDLAPTASDTAAFAQMAAEQPIADAPAPDPAPEPEAKADPAPEPAKAAEPEAKADPEPKAEPDAAEAAKLARHVPFGAVVEERGKRKAAEDRFREAQAELARLRAPAPPQAQEADRPDAQTDPIAVIQRLEQREQQREEQDRQQREFGTFQQTVMAKEAEFVRENPDYPKMVDYLKESRVRELREGLGLNDQQIQQALAGEARDTAAYALQHDLNPAEVFARLAVAKGWKAPAAEPAKPAAADATAKLDTIARGMAAGKSLGSGGGASPEPAITLTSISTMSGAEFDKMWAKDGPVRRMMG